MTQRSADTLRIEQWVEVGVHAESSEGASAGVVKPFQFDDGKLPSLPNAVIYLEKAMQDDSISLHRLAELLSNDPVLAARLVRVANSAYYRGVSPVENVPEAVSRIGFSATRNLALVLLQNSFKARHEVVASMIGDLWMQSVRTAAVASAFSRHYQLVDANRAMLGGLMYNVGAMLLLTRIDEKVDNISQEIVELLLAKHSCQFGVNLLKHWEMDPELVQVVANRDNWQRSHAESPDLADLILVARCCTTGADGTPPDLEYCEALPAYACIQQFLNLSEPLSSVVEAAEESIARTLEMLA